MSESSFSARGFGDASPVPHSRGASAHTTPRLEARFQHHHIQKQALPDFENSLSQNPQYDKTMTDYRCIKIAIKALGACERSQLNYVRRYLKEHRSTLEVLVGGQQRKVYVKYVIVADIEPHEPQLFGILQTHRKYTGLVLVSQATNPLNVALMQNEYENILSQTNSYSNIIAVRWLVFSKFDSSLNTVANAIIVSQREQSPEPDDASQASITQETVLSVATEVVQEVTSELEERRNAPEGAYDTYLEAGELPNAHVQPPSKRKLQGRHRKYIGDLCLLTGLTKEALLNYHASVDLLRAVNDHLWLACALEGACIAAAIQIEEDSTVYATIETIYDKLCESIKLFARFKQIALLEIETSCVAARIIAKAGKNLEATSFVHNAVYVSMPNKSQGEKILRFHAVAELFQELKMPRKAAFFKRIAAMQSISINDSYWKTCLKALESSLAGFGIEEPQKQWADVSARVLSETSYACRKVGRPKKALQYLFRAISITSKNLPMSKQQELISGVESLAQAIHKGKEISNETTDIVESDLEFGVPLLNVINLLPQPSFLKLKADGKSREQVRSGPFIFDPSERHRISQKEEWKLDGVDARSVSPIALNDSVSLGLVFHNPLKIALLLKNLHLIATVEYDDLDDLLDPLAEDSSDGEPPNSTMLASAVLPIFLNITEEQLSLRPKSRNDKICTLSLSPQIQEPTSLLHKVKAIRIVGFKYKIFDVSMVTLFKDLHRTKNQQGGVNFDSILIPVIKPIVPLLEPSKLDNVLNQLNFRYKPDIRGFRSRLSVYPGERLVSNITVENRAPSSATIMNIKIGKNDSGGLIKAVPDMSSTNFSVAYEHHKVIPVDVEVNSVEYLAKLKASGMTQSYTGSGAELIDMRKRSASIPNLERNISGSTQNLSTSTSSSIIDERQFKITIDYKSTTLLKDQRFYSRELDLAVLAQVRKGLEPLAIHVEQNDEDSFKIALTVYNHSKSNEFAVTFNEQQQMDVFPNSEYTISSVIPKLDRLNIGNPRQQLVDFLSKRLTCSWVIYDSEDKEPSTRDRHGFWEMRPELIDELLLHQRLGPNQFANIKIQENRYLLKSVFRPPIVIYSLRVYPLGRNSYQAELRWLNEQPSSPINPTISRLATHSRESATQYSGTVDITQNYKRQWYIDLRVFQESGDDGNVTDFTDEVIFHGNVNSEGRIEGNEYGEVFTTFQFVLAMDASHFETSMRYCDLKVQAKIYIESPCDDRIVDSNEGADQSAIERTVSSEAPIKSVVDYNEFYLSESVSLRQA